MSSTLTEHEQPLAQEASPVLLAVSVGSDRIERTPFYFESEGQPLFAWLHQRKGGPGMDHAVLICPPVGHEHVHSYRTLRHLADQLADQGFTVLRFDYQGTGNSNGDAEEPQRCGKWLSSLRDAAAWLRQHTGKSKLTLIGLRMGAVLAALYAENHPVDHLVLWAPMVKGKRYVRELTALSMTARQTGEAGSTLIEAAGYVFTTETIQELSQIDLLKRSPRCQSALILHKESASKETPLVEHFSAMGAEAEMLSFTGYEEMMADPHDTVVPLAALQSITQWLVSKDAHASGQTSIPSGDGFVTAMSVSGSVPVRETLHRISASPELFGIVSESDACTGRLPWIVMLNAGAAHHIGPGRLHVQLARHLAALGYPCLRIDLCGLGDSVAGPGQIENDTYAATAFRDAAIVIDYLQKQHPGCSVVLMGLCSGAYAAFQCAAQLPHPALVESILLNPLTFYWKDGMKINDSPNERLLTWHYYWNAIFDAYSWRLLLTGKTNMGIKGTVQRFVQRMLPHLNVFARSRRSTGAEVNPQSEYSHPAEKDLKGDLSRVAATSRKLALFVVDNDPGYFLLMYQARRRALQLMRKGVLQYFPINDADHTFSTKKARQTLTQSLTDYLGSRFG